MRISSIEIYNYKGIKRLKLSGLEVEPVIMISGRNGTGKSLLLEAIVSAWSGRLSGVNERVGPWGDSLVVDLRVHVTAAEMDAVRSWAVSLFGEGQFLPDDPFHLRLEANRLTGNWTYAVSTIGVNVLRHLAFQREHPFSIIDFLPANRTVPISEAASIDLAMLNIERVEQERSSMIDTFLQNRSNVNLPNVSSFLATLDYQALLAKRQELAVEDEYSRLKEAFEAATGKVLYEPRFDPSRGTYIDVELPTGQHHALRDLSSGEQEMLALMYFVRRLSAAGGILCLDEPEQHLHPTLQAALFESMRDLATRAQLFVVSHSVNLITTAPLTGLVQMNAPMNDESNQASRISEEPERTDLIAQLGITPADLLQNDILLVVEGDTDAQLLRLVFPVELGRAHIMTAGGSRAVVEAHDTLSKIDIGVPWLCIRDLDLLTKEAVDDLTSQRSNLFVWERREIESMLLHGPLLASVMISNGHETSIEEASEKIEAAAKPLQNDVLEQLVEAELTTRFPPPEIQKEGDRFARMEAYLKAYAVVNEQRAAAVSGLVADQQAKLATRWEAEWPVLVDPKIVLKRLVGDIQIFRNSEDLVASLAAKARDDASVRPTGLEKLRLEIAARLDGPGTGSQMPSSAGRDGGSSVGNNH